MVAPASPAGSDMMSPGTSAPVDIPQPEHMQEPLELLQMVASSPADTSAEMGSSPPRNVCEPRRKERKKERKQERKKRGDGCFFIYLFVTTILLWTATHREGASKSRVRTPRIKYVVRCWLLPRRAFLFHVFICLFLLCLG
mgnify:CR=1 FL=1